jgi:hypothetical protein
VRPRASPSWAVMTQPPTTKGGKGGSEGMRRGLSGRTALGNGEEWEARRKSGWRWQEDREIHLQHRCNRKNKKKAGRTVKACC